MSANRDTRAAWEFHNATKYVLTDEGSGDSSILMGTPPNLGPAISPQDPAIEPKPFKVYTTAPARELPRAFAPFSISGLDALAAVGGDGAGRPSLASIAQVSLLSNGILKRGEHGTGRVIYYRAAGGTGARYHLELYFVTGDLEGLDAGVYQYDAQAHTLRLLRAGDYRAHVVAASGDEHSLAAAPAIMAVTSTFWRNAWRYQGRAYRHAFWDLGTTLANILAVSASQEIATNLVMGFADDEVNRLLGVDGVRESTLALLALGVGAAPAAAAPPVTPLDLPTEPISSGEIEYPAITRMHAATKLSSNAEVAAWRGEPLRRPLPPAAAGLIPFRPLSPADLPDMPIDAIIQRRRSTRHFNTEVEIPFEKLSTLLDVSMRGVASDSLDPSDPALNDAYLIVNNVAELERGAYVVDPGRRGLELLKSGDMRAAAAALACGQGYAAECAVNLYYLANLEPILEQYGNRGYRIAQVEGALYASKLHLATHALGLGAVGSTSVDDEVTDFFSPHAAGKSFMFILAFGQKRRRTAS